MLFNHDIDINIAGTKANAKVMSLENGIIAENNINQSILVKFVLESSKVGVSRDRNNIHNIHIFTHAHTYTHTHFHIITPVNLITTP